MKCFQLESGLLRFIQESGEMASLFNQRGSMPRLWPVARRGGNEGAPSAWREDLGAGLVVFLVALPLCLGIALASGAPLASGLVTGAVGGLLVSRLSGSQLMVSGPAAGLTAIVLAALVELGSFEAFLLAVTMAGVLQMLMGVARAGVVGHFFPSSVIRGMLAGIGLILIIKQLPYAMGIDRVVDGSGWLASLSRFSPPVLFLTLASLAILALWPRFVPASWRKMMPAPLAVVLLGSVAVWLLGRIAPQWAFPAGAMVALPVPAELSDLRVYFSSPDWSALSNPAVYKVAVTVAIVASLESLLSLEATDKLDPLKRTSSPDRELLAQGAGNVISGLIGGLPMTGVIVRSAANVDAGARTWRASFVHGVLLVGAVASVPSLLNHIPLASLAAVLIHTGFKLAHPSQLADARRHGAKYALPFVATIVAILASDLLIGIAVGVATSLLFIVIDSSRNAYSFQDQRGDAHQEILLTLAEEVTFLNKARISSALRDLPAGAVVTVDATRSKHLDHDVVELLHEHLRKAQDRGIRLVLKGVPMTTAGSGTAH
jgi:MFS superfamily sulfate permease-like transporter